MHIHAFSPLEVYQGAHTLGVSLNDFLRKLKAAGLDTLPGTAAEILHDEVRDTLCPDKLTARQWLEVMEASITSSHCRAVSLSGHRVSRTSSCSISAAVPGSVSNPAAFSFLRKSFRDTPSV